MGLYFFRPPCNVCHLAPFYLPIFTKKHDNCLFLRDHFNNETFHRFIAFFAVTVGTLGRLNNLLTGNWQIYHKQYTRTWPIATASPAYMLRFYHLTGLNAHNAYRGISKKWGPRVRITLKY